MQKKNPTKTFYHVLILLSTGFAFYLYSDDYTIFPWATGDEALKFLHLITTIPIPLIIALIINFKISRHIKGFHYYLIMFYPLLCLMVIPGFLFLISSLDELMLQLGFGVSTILFLLAIYLMVYDLKEKNDVES